MRHLPMFLLDLLKNKKIRLISGAAAIFVFFIIFFSIGGSFEENENWLEVRRGDFVIELIESGDIQAVNAEFLRAPREWSMDLQIIDLVPEGTIVEKGDFLLQFDTSTLDEEMGNLIDGLKQAEADLRSIDSQQENRLFEMEIGLKIAKYTLEAAELQAELIKFESKNKQEESRIDLEKARIRYGEAENKIETQKIIDKAERMKIAVKLEQAQSMVEQMKRRIDNLTLRAPITGMVVYEVIGGYNPGATSMYKPSVGDKVNSGYPIVKIPDLSKMKVVVKLNEMDAGKLSVGNRVFIRLDAFEDVEYNGFVNEVSTIVEKGNENMTVAKAPSVDVSILIEETDEMLKPGMTAQTRIILKEIHDAISVPVGVVFEDENGSNIIYTRKSYPDPVYVKLGERNYNSVIVTEGLPEGTEISRTPPQDTSHSLGWFAEMERRRMEFREYVGHIGKMDELGITKESVLPDSAEVNSSSGYDPNSRSGSPVMIIINR